MSYFYLCSKDGSVLNLRSPLTVTSGINLKREDIIEGVHLHIPRINTFYGGPETRRVIEKLRLYFCH